MNKYELIDSITVSVDALLDMRGTEKCRMALDIIGRLAALKKGLEGDDKERDAREAALREQLRAFTEDSGDEEIIDGKKYVYGKKGDDE